MVVPKNSRFKQARRRMSANQTLALIRLRDLSRCPMFRQQYGKLIMKLPFFGHALLT